MKGSAFFVIITFCLYSGSYVIYCCIFVLWLFVYYYHVDRPSLSSANTNQASSTSDIPPPAVVTVCFSNEFRCNDGGCVSSDYRCDRINDCKDQSDELDCGKYDPLTKHVSRLRHRGAQCLAGVDLLNWSNLIKALGFAVGLILYCNCVQVLRSVKTTTCFFFHLTL